MELLKQNHRNDDQAAQRLRANHWGMKTDGKTGRNQLKGTLGDGLHAVMCEVGRKMRLRLRKQRHLCAQFGLILQAVLQAISISLDKNNGYGP